MREGLWLSTHLPHHPQNLLCSVCFHLVAKETEAGPEVDIAAPSGAIAVIKCLLCACLPESPLDHFYQPLSIAHPTGAH